MKDDRMERLVVLPFVVGCVSSSSVAVCAQGTRRPPPPKHHPNTTKNINLSPIRDIKEEEDRLSSENMRSSYRFLSTLPKPNISIGLQRLSKSFKSFSQFFVFGGTKVRQLYRVKVGVYNVFFLALINLLICEYLVFKEEMQEVDIEMEIGFPTDVKHITHIGLDGSKTTSIPSSGNGSDYHDNNIASTEFLSFSPISLSQFELAMSAQTDHQHSPLIIHTN